MLDVNRGDPLESFRYVQQNNDVPPFGGALCRQPYISDFVEELSLCNGLPSRDGKWSGTELKPSTEFAPVPRYVSAAIGFFPVADPGKFMSIEKIQNQELQTWIADSNESSTARTKPGGVIRAMRTSFWTT